MAYVYFLRSLKDPNWVYVGSTGDLEQRLTNHNHGEVRSTKSRLPYEIVYKEEYASISEARKREKEIKSSRSKKTGILESLGPIV